MVASAAHRSGQVNNSHSGKHVRHGDIETARTICSNRHGTWPDPRRHSRNFSASFFPHRRAKLPPLWRLTPVLQFSSASSPPTTRWRLSGYRNLQAAKWPGRNSSTLRLSRGDSDAQGQRHPNPALPGGEGRVDRIHSARGRQCLRRSVSERIPGYEGAFNLSEFGLPPSYPDR